ncbi:MAG: DUF3592 domain-containing protein [Steroidobacteraceae bacterium]
MISSLVFVLVGAFLLGNALAWRLRSTRVTGTVIGVRPRGRGTTSYCTVYRYIDAMGRTVDASSNEFSASLAGKQTGLTRELMVRANQTRVRATNSYFLEVGGAVFLVFGLLVAGSRGSTVVGIDLVLGVMFGWYWFQRKDGTGDSTAGSTANRDVPEAAPLQRAEDILATSEAARRAVRNQRRSGPVIAVMGLAFLAAAVYMGRSVLRLEMAGARAPGTVLQLVQRISTGRGGGSTYHPVVRFTTANGAPVQFEDGVGESQSPYRVGDNVQVLYLADSPRSSAIIDRGIGNWMMPFGFGLAGAALIVLGLRQRASARTTELALQSLSMSTPDPPASGATELMMPMNVPPTSEAMQGGTTIQGVTIRAPVQLGRRAGWCVLLLLMGWALMFASVFVPSPKSESATGFGPVLMMLAPALGATLLYFGQGLAIVLIVVHILVRVTGGAETAVSGALARVLNWALTCVLILMASGCVLTAIGLAGDISRYLFKT